MDTKLCRTCGETKPLDEFHRRHTSPDGRTHACAKCLNKRKKELRQAKPDQYRAAEKKTRKKNPELYRAHTKTRYDKNRESEIARVRAWQAQNRERFSINAKVHAANRRAKRWGVPGKLTFEDVVGVIQEAQSKCAECGQKVIIGGDPGKDRLTLDHIHPMGAGGANDIDNLQILCEPCGDAKQRIDIPLVAQANPGLFGGNRRKAA